MATASRNFWVLAEISDKAQEFLMRILWMYFKWLMKSSIENFERILESRSFEYIRYVSSKDK